MANFSNFMDSMFQSRGGRIADDMNELKLQELMRMLNQRQAGEAAAGALMNAQNPDGSPRMFPGINRTELQRSAPIGSGQGMMQNSGEIIGARQVPMQAPQPMMDERTRAGFERTAMGGPLAQWEAQRASQAAMNAPILMTAGSQIGNARGDVFNSNPTERAPVKSDLINIKMRDGSTRSYDTATQQDDILAAVNSGGIQIREPGTSVNVNMTPENNALSGLAKTATEEARTNAIGAFDALYSLDRMQKAMDDGLKPGVLAPIESTVANVLNGLGVDAATTDAFYKAAPGADFDAASKELTRSVIKAFGPNPSNSDRDFAEKMAPQLRTNPNAVPQLIQRIRAKKLGDIKSYRGMLGRLKDNPNAAIPMAELEEKQAQYDALVGGMGAEPPAAPPDPASGKKYIGYTPDGKRVYTENGQQYVE